MSRYQPYPEDEDSEEGQKKKPKKRVPFDKAERVILALSALAVLTTIFSPRTFHWSLVKTGKGKLPAFEILKFPLPEGLPEVYDPLSELRVPVSEYTDGNRLEPILILLRGPWTFGVAEPERVSLALGKSAREGMSYMMYDLAESKINLTLLFNVRRLASIVLSPKSCDPGAPVCLHPYSWGLSKDQTRDLAYESSGVEGDTCGGFQSGTREFYYAVCPVAGRRDEWQVRAIYIQRVTKEVVNPLFVRGLSAPDRASAASGSPSLPEAEYSRLLEYFRQTIELREKVLGPDHSWIPYLKFEMGRMQAEAGHAAEGRKTMAAVIDALGRRVGPEHPDVVAMRAWLPKTQS